jgi:S-formylglutathione hydrolase FrmB
MALPPSFERVRWRSDALQKRMTFLLHLPNAYEEQAAKRYPVLYLLHGSGHCPNSVLAEVRPQEHLVRLGDAALVIPDGDQGWWLDSPELPRSQYGQYLLELVRFVDQHYRTTASRTARGICGFSMGGYGAMLLAAQHPEMFGAASSLLGPLDILQMHPDYYRLRLLLGPQAATWQRFNPTSLASSLAHTSLKFCTAEEAFDEPQNEAFAEALRALGVPFEYEVYAGEHDTGLVRRHVAGHFRFHRRSFDQGAPS